ncbi:MAG: STAS domain-containing protein [Clostridiales bacterium]|jgi:anti-anti-sigma factor|nr:STAS domain-containing protein [Clostridiales bacterium]
MWHEACEVTKEETKNGDIKIIVKGHVDAISAPMLEFEIQDAVNEGYKSISVCMTQVDYFCTIGARVLINAYNQSRAADRKFRIERPSQIVRNVLGKKRTDEMTR